jgi:hypothetical protein
VLTFDLAKKGSTGTGTAFSPIGGGLERVARIGIEFEVEAIGATPTITFTIEGLMADGVTWATLALVQADSTQAASVAGITTAVVGKTFRFVDGLDKRYVRGLRVNVSANTNVTFSARATALAD